MQIFIQKAWIGLSVTDCPLFGSHCTLSLWINGLTCEHCSAYISLCVCKFPAGWLASGLTLGFIMRHVLNRAIQGWGSEGSLGAWDEPEAFVLGP